MLSFGSHAKDAKGRPKRMGRAERAFPWERGLPSPPANGRAHAPRHALRARGGLKVRAPEQCPAAAQGATGIPARDFPPVGRGRRARRDFNPKSAMERGAATPPNAGDRRQGTGDSRELRGAAASAKCRRAWKPALPEKGAIRAFHRQPIRPAHAAFSLAIQHWAAERPQGDPCLRPSKNSLTPSCGNCNLSLT